MLGSVEKGQVILVIDEANKIEERRRKVASMLAQSMTETEISEQLIVDQSTISRDVIAGLGGNYRIRAQGGNDIVCGGAGNDQLDGGTHMDELMETLVMTTSLVEALATSL
jgi:Ca2+-binding RTX toxin-like protein